VTPAELEIFTKLIDSGILAKVIGSAGAGGAVASCVAFLLVWRFVAFPQVDRRIDEVQRHIADQLSRHSDRFDKLDAAMQLHQVADESLHDKLRSADESIRHDVAVLTERVAAVREAMS
jgi:hypothetical protein